MISIVNGGLQPRIFSEAKLRLSKQFEALATYAEFKELSVRVIRTGVRGQLNADNPVLLKGITSDSLPIVAVFAGNNRGSIECTVTGAKQAKLAAAVDELCAARGRSKKIKPVAQSEAPICSAPVVEGAVINQAVTEPDSPERQEILRELVSLNLGSSLPELENFFEELWVFHCDNKTEGNVFLTNHAITSVMRNHFSFSVSCQVAQMYSVRVSPFGTQVTHGTTAADKKRNGWSLDMKRVLAFIEHKAGIPRKARNVTITLPDTLTKKGEVRAEYAELGDPIHGTLPEGEMRIVLNGEDLAARVDNSTGFEASLIAEALNLLAEHETHKENAGQLNAYILEQTEEMDQVLCEIARLKATAERQQLEAAALKARHSEALRKVEETRLPEATIAKLRAMQVKLKALMAVIGD